MKEYLAEESNIAFTENGAAAFASSGSSVLDRFAAAGALRQASDEEIIKRFIRAYSEDRDLSLKLLFYARDVRGGLGERRFFRVILRWLAFNEKSAALKNIGYVAGFGRFDDLLALFGTPCEDEAAKLLKKAFYADMRALEKGERVSLLGKWLPSVNTSNKESVALGKKLARVFGLSQASYRKALSSLRAAVRIIENNLREKDYTFDYAKQPSRAMFKYRKAFFRNDGERYGEFLSAVEKGEATMHADNVAPYELVDPYLRRSAYGVFHDMSEEEKRTLNATWESLPDFCGENPENALAVIDGSGSMYWGGQPLAASVALSLGLYFAGRNRGAFSNSFITFSETPRLIELKGDAFADRLRYAASFNECANTDIDAVFKLVLSAAVKNKVPQNEMPSKLYIISDMEFDCCAENASATNFENAKKNFKAHGYKLPQIVFWNVESRNAHQSVTMNEQGVALVSGVTPRLFAQAQSGELSPYKFMLETLLSERYSAIAA
ncbi:MAG: DUF2828 family protein [Clostridia bacterium]|nr:DUF2828 family protein [Clostridia bacterium]